jgi:hypothetical protein
MFLRRLGAFDKNYRCLKEFSAIARVGAKTRATAISTAFARSKGSGSGKGDLPIADASLVG